MAQGKSFNAMLLVMAGTAMNATRQVQRGQSAFGVIVGGLLFGTICVGLNDLGRANVGNLLGGLFLLTSALVSGVPLIDSVAAAANSYNNTPVEGE